MKIIKDGNAYLVCADNFQNLQESRDYFFIDEPEFERLAGELHKSAVWLADPENQPHQYVGREDDLSDVLLGAFLEG